MGGVEAGQTYQLTIERLVAGGRGVARLEGLPMFVADVVPGDVVQLRVTAVRRGYAEAELVAVTAASPDRVVPRCPVFGACGGCQWQHLVYAAQVRWKQDILREQLQRLAKIPEPTLLPAMAAIDPWHYRSRIQLQVDDAGRVGFYRRGTHEVVEFDKCAIADARINAQLPAVREQLRATGQGRHIGVDASGAFTQVNPAQNEQLQALVADGVRARGGGTVLELYCGNGNLTFALAPHARQVIAVDDHGGAIAQAQAAATAQRIGNVTLRCTAARKAVVQVQRAGTRIDGVLLDPPRRGAAEVVDDLVALAPRYIGYVSCDPATLARDVRTLGAHGYRHVSSQVIDMFPQTHHIESVTWLAR